MPISDNVTRDGQQVGWMAPDEDLGQLDISGMLPRASEAPPEQTKGLDKRSRTQWLKLAAILPAVIKGGPGALEGLLAGFQQAEQQRQQGAQRAQQEQRLTAQDQRAADQQQWNRTYQAATFNRQQRQDAAAAERQREADRRALTSELRNAIGGIDTPEAARLVMEFYAPRFEAAGIPRSQVEAFVMEQATPSTLQVKAAKDLLEEARKAYGDGAVHFSFAVPGEPQPVPYAELERRAGFQRNADAPPRDEPTPGALTEFEAYFANEYLPAVLEERQAAGNTGRLTRREIADLKIQARQKWTEAGRASAPPRTQPATRPPSTAVVRQQEGRLDEELAFILRNPTQATRARWQAIRQGYESLGVPFDARRESIARRLEREDQQAASVSPDVDVVPAHERLSAVDAAIGGGGAPAASPSSAAGTESTRPQSNGRTASPTDVEAVAKRLGLSFDEAKQQLEARGVVVR